MYSHSYYSYGWITIFFLLIIIIGCKKQEQAEKYSKDERMNMIQSVAVSPNGRYVALIDYPGRLWIMDLQSKPLQMRVVDSIQPLVTASFSWDGQYLLVGGIDSTIYAWETTDWKRFDGMLKLPHRNVNTLANQPYTNRWICGSGLHDGCILTIFSFNGDHPPYFTFKKVFDYIDWFDYPMKILFSSHGKDGAIYGYMGELLRFRIRNGTDLPAPDTIYTREYHDFNSLAFDPWGRLLAFSPLLDSAIYIYDWQKKQIIHKIENTMEATAVFSVEGKWLIAMVPEQSDKYSLFFWETRNWQLQGLQILEIHNLIYEMQAVPFRKWLLLYGDNNFYVWDYQKRKFIFEKKL